MMMAVVALTIGDGARLELVERGLIYLASERDD